MRTHIISTIPLFKAQMVSFQCSPLSTPDGIVGTFRQCAQFQKDKDLDTFVSIVVLDEVGLAEDSPRMPLKVCLQWFHPYLCINFQKKTNLSIGWIFLPPLFSVRIALRNQWFYGSISCLLQWLSICEFLNNFNTKNLTTLALHSFFQVET